MCAMFYFTRCVVIDTCIFALKQPQIYSNAFFPVKPQSNSTYMYLLF